MGGELGGSSPSANSLPFAMETTEDPECERSSIVVLFLDSKEMWARPSTNVSGHGRFVGFYAIDRTSKGQMRSVRVPIIAEGSACDRRARPTARVAAGPATAHH